MAFEKCSRRRWRICSFSLGYISLFFASLYCSARECPLFTIHADGTGLKKFGTEKNRISGSPDWSPDGRWIAYDTWASGERHTAAKICVVSADGKSSRIIGSGAMPSWSPDGEQLVCHTYDSPGTIVVMNADGSGRETILNHWGCPRWSPAHDRIASLGLRNRNIHLYDLRTGKERIMRTPSNSHTLISNCQGIFHSEPAEGPKWQRWLVSRLLGEDRFTQVKLVDLRTAKSTPKLLQALGKLCFLNHLYLDRTDSDDAVLATLARLKRLKTLSLRYTPITDNGLENLRNHPQLETLYLTGTGITDDSIPYLLQIPHLKQLYIRWSAASKQGINKLSLARPKCQIHFHELPTRNEAALGI